MVRVLVILATEVGQPSGLSDVAATGKTAKIQDLWPVVAENKGKNERLQQFASQFTNKLTAINEWYTKVKLHHTI